MKVFSFLCAVVVVLVFGFVVRLLAVRPSHKGEDRRGY
jgi:hypothetical protein